MWILIIILSICFIITLFKFYCTKIDLNDTKNNLDATQKVYESIVQELISTSNELDSTKEALNTLQNTQNTLQNDLNNLLNAQKMANIADSVDVLIEQKTKNLSILENQAKEKSCIINQQNEKIMENNEKNDQIAAKIVENNQQISFLSQKISDLTQILTNLQAQSENATKRLYAEKASQDDQLHFSSQETAELQQLARVIPLLSNPAPLNKAIYTIYYQNKIKDLINRLNVSDKTGIYRIYIELSTNAEKVPGDNADFTRSYVGKSVNVGDRWVQHLRRAVGAEDRTNTIFYQSMVDLGIENFHWELIEECPESDLSEREKYWITFYAAKETGFNSKL